MDTNQEQPFFLVWSPQGSRPPSFRHGSELEATREAERLAREHTGHKFYVMSSVSLRVVDDMKRIDLTPQQQIPF